MKPDGTNSFSTADEKRVSPEGNHFTEPDVKTGSEVKKCLQSDGTTWSYLFVHHSKVKGMEAQLTKDGITYFVHKTIRYFKRMGKQKVQHKEIPTVSGLVFFQGFPEEIQTYLDKKFPRTHLCKNCSTGKVAEIKDSQMRPFMRVNETEPERIRFLLKPFHYYARNRILLRITSGELAGLEGYVIRINRDRRLVMDVGGISVTIAGVHAEHFEEVEPNGTSITDTNPFYQRNLQERESIIDRYFHPVKTANEVAVQAENIDYLREYVLAELAQKRMDINKAWNTCTFIIKEIGYYYAPFIEQFKENLAPIMREGGKVLQEMERIIKSPYISPNDKTRYENDYQEILSQYDYLF